MDGHHIRLNVVTAETLRAAQIEAEKHVLKGEGIALSGDIVNLNEIARARGVSVESVRIALQDFKPEGYARIGDLFVSRAKLDEIDQKLTDALRIIDASDFRTIVW